jgi:hypothetical protein
VHPLGDVCLSSPVQSWPSKAAVPHAHLEVDLLPKSVEFQGLGGTQVLKGFRVILGYVQVWR